MSGRCGTSQRACRVAEVGGREGGVGAGTVGTGAERGEAAVKRLRWLGRRQTAVHHCSGGVTGRRYIGGSCCGGCSGRSNELLSGFAADNELGVDASGF